MKSRLFVGIALFVLVLGVSMSYAGEEKTAKEDQQAAMMKVWKEFATPGEPHKALQNLVGIWEANIKSYMDPAAPPTETKGTSTFVSLMEGRYVQETAEGTFDGMPFHGMGTYGYDNLMKKYYSSWIDNMGTGIMTSEGTSTDGGKTINWAGKSSDPMTGKQQNYRSTMKMVTPDQYSFEMFGPAPDGKEVKMMEITYNRKK